VILFKQSFTADMSLMTGIKNIGSMQMMPQLYQRCYQNSLHTAQLHTKNERNAITYKTDSNYYVCHKRNTAANLLSRCGKLLSSYY